MKNRLDERDLKILAILEKNARTPWRQIARMLGISEATVYLRINRMEREGIIKGYTVKLDTDALGLKARILVFIKAKAGYLEKVRNEIVKRNYVIDAYEVTGRYNFMAIVASKNLDEAASLVDELTSIDGVEDVETIFLLRKLKEADSIVDLLGGGQARASGHP